MTATNKNAFNGNLKKIPTIHDNFGLTKSEFDACVTKLYSGDESLFTKVFSTHFHDSVAFLRMKFKINKEIAYDTCMDTMLEFRRKLLEGKIQYGNLRYLFTRMALNNYIDGVRQIQKTTTAIDVFMSGNSLDIVRNEYFFDVIDKVLEEQDEDTKEVIDQIFYIGKHVNQLAKETGVSNATMRKRKQRILDKIKLSFFDIIKSEKS